MKLKTTLLAILAACLFAFTGIAQIPKPSETFGFEPGADYKMASYDQMLSYYEKLDAATDRVKVTEIGKSVHGRPIKLVFISSEENMQNLEKWKEISQKLARARIGEEEAATLAKEGKAIIWFDGGMHATEKAHAQMTPQLMYRIASEESEEMQRIRDEIITLVVPVINPDGLDIVESWYKSNLGTPYETTGPPILYQEYVGHDNNRDWFMSNMPETKAVTTVLYNEWFPQIVHNHHQSSPAWARIFIPPFRSPVNDKIHPAVTTGVNMVGAAMASRFVAKKMPGAISQTTYEMWWNGGMRTVPYYHNMIGILTETAHTTPTPRYYPPDSIPRMVGGKTPNGTEIFYPYPWKGGESHFSDPVRYMIEASMAILDLASRNREPLLKGIYDMGRDAIGDESGAYAYVISKNQWDSGEADNLVNILMQGGLEAHQATSKFSVGDKTYEAGSYIFYGAQSFRPYLADLLEKQNYPELYQYPGGPPISPYDLTGWTLPMQMGVNVDRIDATFSAKTKELTAHIQITPGSVTGSSTYGYALANKENRSYKAINQLVSSGQKVFISDGSFADGKNNFSAGTFVIMKSDNSDEAVKQVAEKNGVTFTGLKSEPSASLRELGRVKVGLYKSWQANMDEGWTRFVLEQYEFDFDTLHNEEIQSGNLSQYSAIIFPEQDAYGIMNGHEPGSMPEKYVGGIGLEGLLEIENYVKQGGVLIMFGGSSELAIEQFGLPVSDVTSNWSRSQFFIPGSIVKIKNDLSDPISYGMQEEAGASFRRNGAFRVETVRRYAEGGREDTKPVEKPDVKIVSTYSDSDVLMSGWGQNPNRIRNMGAVANVGLGNGRVILFGFRPQFRAQPRGTYKLIFNSIYLGASSQKNGSNKTE